MNITQILLGAIAAILLAALGFSYNTMRHGEKQDERKEQAQLLLQEIATYKAELRRLETGQPLTAPVPKVELPAAISEEQLNEIKIQNKLLR